MSLYPKCERIDCFQNKCGARCNLLYQKTDHVNCPFFKTDEQLDRERLEAHERLKAIGRDDLIKKYEYNPYRKW